MVIKMVMVRIRNERRRGVVMIKRMIMMRITMMIMRTARKIRDDNGDYIMLMRMVMMVIK